MNIDEAGGDYLALGIKFVLTADSGVDLAYLGDGAIFDKDGSGLVWCGE